MSLGAALVVCVILVWVLFTEEGRTFAIGTFWAVAIVAFLIWAASA